MSKAATKRKKQRQEAMVFRMLLVAYHNSIQRSKSEPEHYLYQCPANYIRMSDGSYKYSSPKSLESYWRDKDYSDLYKLYEDWVDPSTYIEDTLWWEDPANERIKFTLEYWHVNEQDKMAKSLMGRLYPEFDALDWDDHMDGHREAYEQMIKWESVYPDDVCCDYYYEGCERAEKEDWTNWWFK